MFCCYHYFLLFLILKIDEKDSFFETFKQLNAKFILVVRASLYINYYTFTYLLKLLYEHVKHNYSFYEIFFQSLPQEKILAVLLTQELLKKIVLAKKELIIIKILSATRISFIEILMFSLFFLGGGAHQI